MTLSEKDHLQAIRNQIAVKRDSVKAQAEAAYNQAKRRIAQLNDKITALDNVRNSWDLDIGDEGNGEVLPPVIGITPISESIDKFIEETGKQEFSAADVLHYCESQGYSGKTLYASIYETLTRRVKNQRLVKVGERGKAKFKVRGEENADPKKES